MSDRRAEPRYDVIGALWGVLELHEEARLRNVSATGVLLDSPVPMALDSAQTIRLEVDGQGITVAALQAEAVAGWLAADRAIDHRLQRRLRAITDLPWSIATSNDLRFPTATLRPSVQQRLAGRLTDRMARLAAAGNARATRAFSDVYHLMASPAAFLHPALLLAAARPLPDARLPRPAVLDELSRSRREQPPAAPADA